MKKFIVSCVVAAVLFISLGFNIERAQAGTYANQLISNGNFESGATGWSTIFWFGDGESYACTDCISNSKLIRWHSGNWGALLGGYADLTDAVMKLDELTLPSTAKQITFSYYYWFESSDADDGDLGYVAISDSITQEALTDITYLPSTDNNSTNDWVRGILDLTPFKGRQVDITFMSTSDTDSAITRFFIDDVSVLAYFDDFSRPTGTISINKGAYSTTSKYVTLYLKATDTGSGVKYMRFSNNGKKWTGWKKYASHYHNWNMTSSKYGGTTIKGKKTVYVQFKDRAGNISYKKHDHIIYR
jgi:hypothetical protein